MDKIYFQIVKALELRCPGFIIQMLPEWNIIQMPHFIGRKTEA